MDDLKIESDSKREEDVAWLIDIWNSSGPSQIKNRGVARKSIKSALRNWTTDELVDFFFVYAAMYHDANYFFDYKYAPETFFTTRVLEKFHRDGSLWTTFIARRDKAESNKIESGVDCESYSQWVKDACSMKYSDYLNTTHWKRFAKAAVKHFGGRCCLCDSMNSKLNVHHKTYENRGRETFLDVIVLCEDCHKLVHKEKSKA